MVIAVAYRLTLLVPVQLRLGLLAAEILRVTAHQILLTKRKQQRYDHEQQLAVGQ